MTNASMIQPRIRSRTRLASETIAAASDFAFGSARSWASTGGAVLVFDPLGAVIRLALASTGETARRPEGFFAMAQGCAEGCARGEMESLAAVSPMYWARVDRR